MFHLLRLFISVIGLSFLATGCGEPPPRSVVIITLDTTRVDHLSSYGYERNITPNLQAFQTRAVRFNRAWSTASWTLPAHASLFTGLYPATHGAHYQAKGDAVLGAVVHKMPTAKLVRAGKLAESKITLAEILAERGYRTGAFVAGPWLHRGFGLLQGFETTDDDIPGFAGRSAKLITDHALTWLEKTRNRQPYFLFINYFDPHAPYLPRPGYDDLPKARIDFKPPYARLMRGTHFLTDEERSILIDHYDGEIRYMDHHLGRLLRAVFARPGGEDTLVVILADHGEAFGEGGRFGHGFWLSEELLHVPLLVHFPGHRRGGSNDDTLIQPVDIFPLVAAELGFEPPEGIEGVSPGKRDVAFAQIYREPTTVARFGERYNRDLVAVIDGFHMLIRSDRGERSFIKLGGLRVAADDPAKELSRDQLATRLDEYEQSMPAAPVQPVSVDAQTLEVLRSLGYVQ